MKRDEIFFHFPFCLQDERNQEYGCYRDIIKILRLTKLMQICLFFKYFTDLLEEFNKCDFFIKQAKVKHENLLKSDYFWDQNYLQCIMKFVIWYHFCMCSVYMIFRICVEENSFDSFLSEEIDWGKTNDRKL